MSVAMLNQGSRLAKTSTTLVALIGFDSEVDESVITEVVATTEAFVTHVTGERSLVGVCALVDLYIVGLTEHPRAVLAYIHSP